MGRLHATETMRKSYQRLATRNHARSLTCQLVTVSYLTRVNCGNETLAEFVNDCAHLALAILEPAGARLVHSPGDEHLAASKTRAKTGASEHGMDLASMQATGQALSRQAGRRKQFACQVPGTRYAS